MITELYDVAHRAYRFIFCVSATVRSSLWYADCCIGSSCASSMSSSKKQRCGVPSTRAIPFHSNRRRAPFFYAGSTVHTRAKLIQEHYAYLEQKLGHTPFVSLGYDTAYEIWRASETDMTWHAYLKFEPGQRKEGLLSVMMAWRGSISIRSSSGSSRGAVSRRS